MYLKSDFQRALVNAVTVRPAAAAAYSAGDPRLLAQMDAMSTMMAMLSQQVDVAESEPFLRARDGTVLADAALKGMLPLGRSARVSLVAKNTGAAPVTLAAGRMLLDNQGRSYRIESAATVVPGGVAFIAAQQISVRTITHTVAASMPFYAVQVPPSDDGLHLVGLEVEDTDGQFAYRADYANVVAGDRCYHAETDEYRRLYVRFGASDAEQGLVVGHQPATGDVLTIRVSECTGPVELTPGVAFSLEYIAAAADASLTLELDEVLSAGAAPPTIETLRMLSRYPALHDKNAVFMGDFDALLRRQMASQAVEFISVWNEQVEEAVRGASQDNINRLFVSLRITGQDEATTQAQARAIITRADNSYRLTFKALREVPVPLTVVAQVSVVHDTGDVEAQIRAALLAQYGRGSVAAAAGMMRTFRTQDAHDMLRKQVVALQDQLSDFSVKLTPPGAVLPEDFLFLTADSIAVNVTRRTESLGLWNA